MRPKLQFTTRLLSEMQPKTLRSMQRVDKCLTDVCEVTVHGLDSSGEFFIGEIHVLELNVGCPVLRVQVYGDTLAEPAGIKALTIISEAVALAYKDRFMVTPSARKFVELLQRKRTVAK